MMNWSGRLPPIVAAIQTRPSSIAIGVVITRPCARDAMAGTSVEAARPLSNVRRPMISTTYPNILIRLLFNQRS